MGALIHPIRLRTCVRMNARRPPPPTRLVQRRGRPPSATRTRPVEVRTCKHHGDVEFGNYSAGNGKFRWICKRCVAEAVTRRHQKIKRTLVAEAGGCCAVCGYDRSVVNLHFHHVDPASKLFAVSTASGKALATFREEAKKCVLVCANCHGEIEASLIPSPPAQARHGETWAQHTPTRIPSTANPAGGAEAPNAQLSFDQPEA